jgi:putative Mg2+ transporter-C (MgtC) family protein
VEELTTVEVTLRLLVATLIGAGLGLDRELRDKPAGLRTHALVALGAALVMVTTIDMTAGDERSGDSVSRVIQGIIAGVGFLGAGAILKTESHLDIRGLTTAASIWLVASMGVACGAGYWRASLIALTIAIVTLVLGAPLESFMRKHFRGRKDHETDRAS